MLYRGTLAALTLRQIGDRTREDVRRLSAILTEILAQSVLGAPAAERFAREEAGHGSLWWTRAVFRRIVGEFRQLRAQGVVTFRSGYSLSAGAFYVGVYVHASGEAVAVGLDLGPPSITNFAEEVATAIHEQFGTRLGIDPARLSVVHYHEGHRDPIDGYLSGVLTNEIPLWWDGDSFHVRTDGAWGHPSRRDLEARIGESLKPIITAALEQRRDYRKGPA